MKIYMVLIDGVQKPFRGLSESDAIANAKAYCERIGYNYATIEVKK